MDIRPIRTKADHQAALKEIDNLMQAGRDTPEGERLDVLVTLVEAYERKHFPMDLPDPIEAIRFRMEQSGLSAKDLVPMIGQLNRVYEVLNRKRPLTLSMIRALHEKLGIPSELLIREPTARYRVRRHGGKRARVGERKRTVAPVLEEPRASYRAAPKLDVPKQRLQALCRKYRIRKLSVFGSAARGEATAGGDVDLMVEFEPESAPSLWDFPEMQKDFSALFGGRRVDLVPPQAMDNPHRRKSIARDLRVLYGR